MKPRKIFTLFMIMIILFQLYGCNEKRDLEESCIQDFETYAYFLNRIDLEPDEGSDDYIQLPKSPWELETEVPEYYQEDWQLSYYSNLEAIRNVNNETEIWIDTTYKKDSDQQMKRVFPVYNIERGEWRFVEAELENPNIFVLELFVSGTGDLWSKFIVDNIETYPENSKLPFLGKYDDASNSFTIVSEIYQYEYTELNNPNILLDDQGVLWMLNAGVGIFKFNPEEQHIEKVMDTPEYSFGSPVISNDGTIYFLMQEFDYQNLDTLFLFLDNTLFQFFPDDVKIEAVEAPKESWPIASTLLFDQSGRLWYGAIGYQDVDSEWVLLHPDKEEYYEHMQYQEYAWQSPYIIFESSDDLLWFKKRTDIYRIDGTAWYDPETGEGCKVTNQISDVFEDSEGTIWLLAEHGLYKYKK